jgi:hypothetical protein
VAGAINSCVAKHVFCLVGVLDRMAGNLETSHLVQVDNQFKPAYCFGVPLGDAFGEWATPKKSPAGLFF